MRIGCPKEVKNRECRVGLTPAAAAAYTHASHEVIIENNAGLLAGFTNEDYIAAGAKIIPVAADIWASAEMIVKVKEPLPSEYSLMRDSQIIYTYFHLAADKELTKACLSSGATCIAYELVQEPWGLPLLQPMSEVAGKMSTLMGAFYLGKTYGGSGLLPTGVPGVPPAHVLVIGGGVVGTNAAKVASGIGAGVVITDVDHKRLSYLSDVMPANCIPLYSDSHAISEQIQKADIVVGAVLLPGGAKAPRLVTREHLKTMRPGSVFIDVAIDQGGIGETSHATTHDDPIYVEEGVVHYCVANMPGAYARTSAIALNNATIKYGLQIAGKGAAEACRSNAALAKGLSTYKGKLTVKAVADEFAIDYEDISKILI